MFQKDHFMFTCYIASSQKSGYYCCTCVCPKFTAFMSVYQHVHRAGSILVTVPVIGTSLKFRLSFKIKIVVDAPWI